MLIWETMQTAGPVDYMRPRILVVDDEPMILALCRIALSGHYDLTLASNGKQALDMYQSSHQQVSLVLTDVSMPQMNGIQLARRIFEREPHANIILMTGFPPEELVPDEVRKLCAILLKPFTVPVLVQTIQKCLNHDREKRQEVA